MADGTANIVYAVGDARRQWQRGDATIVGNTLRVARATYELTGNDQLDATFEGDNGRSRATMSRIELAYLTRPGATISRWPPADLLVADVPLPRNVSVLRCLTGRLPSRNLLQSNRSRWCLKPHRRL